MAEIVRRESAQCHSVLRPRCLPRNRGNHPSRIPPVRRHLCQPWHPQLVVHTAATGCQLTCLEIVSSLGFGPWSLEISFIPNRLVKNSRGLPLALDDSFRSIASWPAIHATTRRES